MDGDKDRYFGLLDEAATQQADLAWLHREATIGGRAKRDSDAGANDLNLL